MKHKLNWVEHLPCVTELAAFHTPGDSCCREGNNGQYGKGCVKCLYYFCFDKRDQRAGDKQLAARRGSSYSVSSRERAS